ncbi:MAG: glycosyl hydrolase family 28-related protein [Peptococcia bacterium]
MKNRRVLMTLLAVTLFLLVPFSVLGATLHVGPGQTYNGTTQDAINNAINAANSGDTVYLHAATYNITKAILLKSGITLRGDGNSTVIHAAGDNVCNNPSNEKDSSYIIGNDVSNVTISNLRFTSTANDKNDGGHGDGRNCIQFRRSSNCTVNNITVTRWQWCDGVRVSKSSGITVHDCDINAAHDGISFFASKNCKAYNNNISVQINNAIRAYSSENVEIYKNTFTSRSDLGGWCCIQIQESAKNVNIHHNIFHDTAGKTGVAPYNFSGSNIQVHDNVFWNCAKPIEVGTSSNNIIDPSQKDVSYWVSQGYGKGSSGNGAYSSGSSSSGSTSSDSNNSSSNNNNNSCNDGSCNTGNNNNNNSCSNGSCNNNPAPIVLNPGKSAESINNLLGSYNAKSAFGDLSIKGSQNLGSANLGSLGNISISFTVSLNSNNSSLNNMLGDLGLSNDLSDVISNFNFGKYGLGSNNNSGDSQKSGSNNIGKNYSLESITKSLINSLNSSVTNFFGDFGVSSLGSGSNSGAVSNNSNGDISGEHEEIFGGSGIGNSTNVFGGFSLTNKKYNLGNNNSSAESAENSINAYSGGSGTDSGFGDKSSSYTVSGSLTDEMFSSFSGFNIANTLSGVGSLN